MMDKFLEDLMNDPTLVRPQPIIHPTAAEYAESRIREIDRQIAVLQSEKRLWQTRLEREGTT